MRRKLVVLIAVLLLVVPATLFAGSLIGLDVGVSGLYLNEISIDGPIDLDLDEVSLDSFYFGGEVRLNVSIAELSAFIMPTMFGEYGDGHYYAYLNFLAGLGVSVELFDLVDVALTAGPWGVAVIGTDGYFDGGLYSENLWGRLSADVDLGSISLGAYTLFDSQINVSQVLDPGFDPNEIQMPNSVYLGISALIQVF